MTVSHLSAFYNPYEALALIRRDESELRFCGWVCTGYYRVKPGEALKPPYRVYNRVSTGYRPGYKPFRVGLGLGIGI